MQDEFMLFETKFWKVVLSDEQSYLGRCVILLKRDCGELSNLTSEEWLDFHENIVKKLESTFKKVFDATMFNWTCLMNDAYQAENPKPYVHFHLRPRYNHDVKFIGEEFHDPDFGHHYNRERKNFVSKELLKKISDEVKKYL
ncbi:HIT family protein [Candidatus Woesearchaeota archaeon]|nr:HIT family protein [Candidatus Woesearchaeota archaeon]